MRKQSEKQRDTAGSLLAVLKEKAVIRFPMLAGLFLGIESRETEEPCVLETDGEVLYYHPETLIEAYRRSKERMFRHYVHVSLHILLEQKGADRRGENIRRAQDLKAAYMAALLFQEKEDRRMLRRLFELQFHVYEMFAGQTDCLAFLEKRQKLSAFATECRWDEHLFEKEEHFLLPKEEAGRATAALKGKQKESLFASLYERLMLFADEADPGGMAKGNGKNGPFAEEYEPKDVEEIDFTLFLRDFMTAGEEPITDTASFDYIPYHYGLEYYGNLPFLEPLEYKEVYRLDEIAIAIDTSGSCSGMLVRRFLEETRNILKQRENFFSNMRLHFIQCDSTVEEYRIFESIEQFEEAIPDLKILGHGNTDFRPVFELLEKQIACKEIRNLKVLLYFTDGDGIYPVSRPEFPTAFVFLSDRTKRAAIPSWGISINLHLPGF